MKGICLTCAVLVCLALSSRLFAENTLTPVKPNLKSAQLGESYRQKIRSSQGKQIRSCATEGYLPSGLTLSNGLIAGTPTRIESCNICVKSGSRSQNTFVRKAYRLTVTGEIPYSILTQVTRQATANQDGEIALTVAHIGSGIPIDSISASFHPLGCSKSSGGSSLLNYQPASPIQTGEFYSTNFEFPQLTGNACIKILVEAYDGASGRLDCGKTISKTLVNSDL